MKLALFGYGGMGKAVATAAHDRGHEIPCIVDPTASEAHSKKASPENLKGIDVAIDFSTANTIQHNVQVCVEAGVNLVVGTTGWLSDLKAVEEAAKGIGFLWSSNFSIGVNLYFKIIEHAAMLINRCEEYDVWGHEIHHTKKADSPSGTAKTLEQILLKTIERKKRVVEDRLDRRREEDEIHFSSVRGGLVNFGHTIGFDSPSDRILITHEARNRDGYALGAVKAAEWVHGKKGCFEMEDFLKDAFGNRSSQKV